MYGPGIQQPQQQVRQYQHKPLNAGSQKPALGDLPMNLMQMFEPRHIIQFKKAMIKPTNNQSYTGLSAYLNAFEKEKPKETSVAFITPKELKMKYKENLLNLNKEKNELLASEWNPHSNPKATENPYFTLFVGRLSYDITEKKLRREFEQYGTIKKIVIVNDLTNKPKGYAFIEFEKEEHMMVAYKKCDGKKIDGRRIVVDVERGRTVRSWRPTRLGGGKGGRIAIKSKKQIEEAAALAAIEAEKARSSTASIYGSGRIETERPRSRDRGSDRPRGNSRDRGSERPRGNSRDRGMDRGPERDRGMDRPDRGMDRPDRGQERDRGMDRPDRGQERDRGMDRPERGQERDRGMDRPDRGQERDRGMDRPDRGQERDRGMDRGQERDRGMDRGPERDRGIDRGPERDRGMDRGPERDRGMDRNRDNDRQRSRSRDRGIGNSNNNNSRTAGLGYR